jgi:hypothetical protein
MDYRFTDVYARMNDLESGLLQYSTTYGYDSDENIISEAYDNNEAQAVLIEYSYDASGDIDAVTGKLDTILQYTKTFVYDSEGNITNTVVV